jgi:hypothetical protein
VHPFPDGVFVHTAGSAPHRTFTVSWQGNEDDTGNPVLAQAVFSEGSQNLAFLYGRRGGASATIGIQSKQQLSATEWNCDFGSDVVVAGGLRIAATHQNGEPPA